MYWCAVVGWLVHFLDEGYPTDLFLNRSGSIMFQRDLRQWAKDKW